MCRRLPLYHRKGLITSNGSLGVSGDRKLGQREDEEAATEQAGQAVIAVPDDLLPAIRQLLASHGTA